MFKKQYNIKPWARKGYGWFTRIEVIYKIILNDETISSLKTKSDFSIYICIPEASDEKTI